MDPLSALRLSLPSSSPERPEGRIESVDDRRGTVSIRLSSGEMVEAQGTGGLATGDKVLLQKVTDKLWLARPVAQNRSATSAAIALPSTWASLAGAENLAQAVRSADIAQIRAALSLVAGEIANRPVADLPTDLLPAKTRGLSPLASVGSRQNAPSGADAVPLSLLEETSPGAYRAEAAGRGLVLQGATNLPTGAAGLWTESVMNAVVSLWTPASLESAESPDLPARISADASGARRLLDRLGVASPDTSDPSFRSLVKALVRAASLPSGESALAPASARSASGSAASSPTAAASASLMPVSGEAVLVSAAGSASSPFSGKTDSVVIAGAVPESVSREPSSASLPRMALSGGALSNAVVDDMAGGAGASPDAAGRAGTAAVVAKPSKDGAEPAVATASEASTPARTLGSVAALRVVCAWALSEGEPSDAVLAAAVGSVEDLPEAIHRLAGRAIVDPERFPEVAAFFSTSDPERPLMPHRLGFDAAKVEGDRVDDQTRPLASAVVGDLARALKEDRSSDAQVLRQALHSLVGEGLAGAKDPSNPMASAPWSMPPRGERPDSGSVVVRDRRRHRGGVPERTVIDVSMNPSGLGTVGARLETVGKELDVQFRAKEPATAEKIRDGLPELRQILSGLGYETRELGVEGGKSATPETETRRPGSSGLLDIHA